MGLRDRKDVTTRTFRMREQMFAVGDDYWVEDEAGQRVFKVNGKALRLRKTYVLEDPAGSELAKIREKKLSVRDTMVVTVGGHDVVVHKRLFGIRDRFLAEVDGGGEYTAKGNFVDHEYEIEHDGSKVAQVSKKWFRVRDTYGVEVIGEQDLPLLLSITVCIDHLSNDRPG